MKTVDAIGDVILVKRIEGGLTSESNTDRRVGRIHVGACGMGLGHVGRLLPTLVFFRRKGWDIYVSTYGDAVKFSLSSGFRTYREPDVTYGTVGAGVSLALTIASLPSQVFSFIRQVAMELKLMWKEKPSIVVSDSRLSTVLAARLAGVKTVLLIHELLVIIPGKRGIGRRFAELLSAGLLAHLWSLADRIVISDFPAPLTLAEDNVYLLDGVPNKAVFAGPCGRTPSPSSTSGPIYMRVSGLPQERKVLADLYLEAGRLLAERGIDVVVSVGDVGKGLIGACCAGRLKVVGWVQNPWELGPKAIVSVGGQTSMAEFLAFGVPLVLTPPRSHTEHWAIASSLRKKGLAIVIPLEEATSSSVAQAVEHALSDPELRRAAREFSRQASAYPGDSVLQAELLRVALGS